MLSQTCMIFFYFVELKRKYFKKCLSLNFVSIQWKEMVTELLRAVTL